MRIAIVLPAAQPPMTRAGALWTRATRQLSEALAERGLEVTPVAVQTPGLDLLFPSTEAADSALRIANLFRRASDFDLIHDLVGFPALPYSCFVATPVLATVWKEMCDSAASLYAELDQRVFFLAPGEDRMRGLHYAATVPWAVDVDSMPFLPGPHDTLAFVGAVDEGSGVIQALEIAKKAERSLVLVGTTGDHEFFDREIAPKLDGALARHLADPGGPEADQAIGKAMAVLHFGDVEGMQRLTLLDAMARGTPVIVLDGDRNPPLVVDGECGFHCENQAGAVDALARIPSLSRSACRDRVKENFSSSTMLAQLEKVYTDLVTRTQRVDHRPWGYYEVLSDEADHKVKRLVLYPGKRLSLQRHRHRQEHWFLVNGEAMVVQNDDEEIRVLPGQSIEIPKGCWHRLRNPGAENLSVIEVQTGDYFGEDDIERMEDDFGRV